MVVRNQVFVVVVVVVFGRGGGGGFVTSITKLVYDVM